LTFAASDISIVGTNKFTVSAGLKWYAGYFDVPTVEIAGTRFACVILKIHFSLGLRAFL
jgi:hypothetical protein